MEKYKVIIRDTFNKVSNGYDNKNLRFFKTSAVKMLNLLNIKGDEYMLDIAAGTGNVTIEAAKLLTEGKVHATDISNKMLDIIKNKAVNEKLDNITLEENDMESLSYGPVFDVATCAFGIFFLADMLNGLKQIKTNIKKGGKLIATTFNDTFLYPLGDMFYNRLEKYGVERNPTSWDNINNQEKTVELLRMAGYKDISITMEQHGFYLKDAKAWWDVIWNAGMRRAFVMLPEEKHESFIKEHLLEIQNLATDQGIWMDVEVIFAIARI